MTADFQQTNRLAPALLARLKKNPCSSAGNHEHREREPFPKVYNHRRTKVLGEAAKRPHSWHVLKLNLIQAVPN